MALQEGHVVSACWAGDQSAGQTVVKPLRALGTAITDLLGPIPYVDLQQLVDPLWEAGAANYFTSAFLDQLPAEAIETLADIHRRSADLPVQAEIHIHQLGGAVAGSQGTAPHFPTAAPVGHQLPCPHIEAADLPPHLDWARAARNAMASYGNGGMYVNFTGEGGEDNLKASYPPEIYARLQEVKDQYDPFNVFRFNINIPPTA